jgi:hypothetical protein
MQRIRAADLLYVGTAALYYSGHSGISTAEVNQVNYTATSFILQAVAETPREDQTELRSNHSPLE